MIAECSGREINLAESWEGAESRTELPSGEVHCHDSDPEAVAGPELPAEIREQTRKATAAPAGARAAAAPPDRCVADSWVGRYSINHGDAKITDLRSWSVEDRVRRLDPPGGCSDLRNLDCPGGCNRNDKAHIFEVRRSSQVREGSGEVPGASPDRPDPVSRGLTGPVRACHPPPRMGEDGGIRTKGKSR